MESSSETWRVFEHPIYVEARANRMTNLFTHFDPRALRGMRVLEAGCGTGELGEFLEKYGCRVVSVDAREEFLVRLRQKYPHREARRIDLEHWDPEALGRFDAILAFGILYHLAEPESFLEGCTRITNTIFLESMVQDSPWAAYARLADSQAEGPWSGVGSRPTGAWIERTFARRGFEAQNISKAAANWYGPFPSLFDWEPRNTGGWTRGSSVLRRMWICRKRPTLSRPVETEPFRLSRLPPEVEVDLAPGDPESPRTVHTLRRAGYGMVNETGSAERAGLTFRRFEETGADLRPLLVHVHIPKCAGTSFLRVLQTSFGDRHRDYYPEDPSRQLTREECLRLVLERPSMQSCSSHSIRLFPPVLADRQLLYVAFLRDPLRRYVSHLTYYKKHFHTLPDAMRRHLPGDCAGMPLRALAEWLFAHQPESFHRSLLAVNFLAEQTWVHQVGGMLKLENHWLDAGTILDRGFEPVKLALATALLEDFFFVGLVEEMDAGLRLLRRKLAPHGLELADLPAPVENVSHELAGDLSWLDPEDPIGRRVLTQLETDRQLYRRFQSRFRALCHN